MLDDHPIVIEAIKTIIKSSKKLNFKAGLNNERELKNYLENNNDIDCILLDLNINNSDIDGIDICRSISSMYPNVKIIIFSSFNQRSFVLNALKNGASGYMIKNSSLEEIILGIETVLSGKIYLHESLGNVFFSSKSNNFNYIPKLTRREKEILKLILEENTTAQIASKLYISVSTVETHRTNIFSKTNVKNMAGLIKIAFEKNLLE